MDVTRITSPLHVLSPGLSTPSLTKEREKKIEKERKGSLNPDSNKQIHSPERLVFITNGDPEREADPGYKRQGLFRCAV
jgi:hypothetical protein